MVLFHHLAISIRIAISTSIACEKITDRNSKSQTNRPRSDPVG